MFRVRDFAKYWLPAVLWAIVIFSASSDSGSSEHTSRFLGPLLHKLFPFLSPPAIADLCFAVRKTAHVAEYALLGLLLWRAVRRPIRGDSRPWSWSQARIAFWITVAYAGSDEFHQFFVPSREARVHDVAIDAIGAAAGLLLLWALGKWRKHW